MEAVSTIVIVMLLALLVGSVLLAMLCIFAMCWIACQAGQIFSKVLHKGPLEQVE